MRKLLLVLACVIFILPALTARADGAAAVAVAGIRVDAAWVREVPPVSQNSVAYLRVRNTGKQEDYLLGVDTPVAASAELHDMIMNGNVMRMDKISKARVPAGGELLFDPDSKHIMLLGLKGPLKAGQNIPLTLHFRTAGVVTIMAKVKADDSGM